ncbi:MAG: copper amine oxidase N-terminal protein [Clostridia bacterium]|jgi:hypothetical protein|nr:copper amine oxidase N-terminal protein [Clostridia bacterium]
MTLYKSSIYLLIIAILFTTIPIMSYGASDNRITKVVTVGQNDILNPQDAPVIVLDLKDDLQPEDTFYLTLEGAEWAVGTGINEIIGQIQGMPLAEIMPSLEIQKINSKELQVRVKAEAILRGASLKIPLHTKITGTAATVTINNNNTAVTADTYIFAKTMDARGTVKSGEVLTATGSAVMADLIIEEPYSQAFTKSIGSGKRNKIQMILNSNDYEFALDIPEIGVPKLIGIKGFDTLTGGVQNLRKIDAQTLELTLPDVSGQKYTGGFILRGVVLKAAQSAPKQGMITVTAEGDLIHSTSVNVLQVTDYGIDLTAPSAAALVAGKSKTVKFILEEKVQQSLIRERFTSFTFTNGTRVKLNQDNKVDVMLNGTKMSFYPIIQNSKAVGFEVPQLPGTSMKYEFELMLDVPAATEGEVKVVAEGRSLLNILTAKLIDVVPPVNITVSPMYLKLGIKDQKGGKIVISEMAKGEIEQDAALFIKIEQNQVDFTAPPSATVIAGDIRLGSPKLVTGGIEVPIIRRSNVPSTIEIKDFLVTVNQMVPEGTYQAEIGGSALSDLASSSDIDTIKKAAFMIISKDGAAPSTGQKVTFTIGQAAYTVGGDKKVMDAAPYIKNGRTMLPIKYVAYALGIPEANVLWNETTRTVTVKASQVIELKIGSTSMKTDGVVKVMSAPPEINNGRTFVPVAEITRALGVVTLWDENLRTVVFN